MNSDIKELAGEASAYISEVHKGPSATDDWRQAGEEPKTMPSEVCVDAAVTGGPANPSSAPPPSQNVAAPGNASLDKVTLGNEDQKI